MGLEAARLFAASSSSNRERMRAEVSPGFRKKLLSVSGFMAEEALNDRDHRWIEGAVLMHVIDDFGGDYRENFRYLVLVSYAATQTGASLSSVVDGVSRIMGPGAKRLLREFCQRDGSLSGLGSFGVKVDLADGRFRFVPV